MTVLILTHAAAILLGLTVKAAACYQHGVDSGRRLTEREHHLRPAETRRTRRRLRRAPWPPVVVAPRTGMYR